jgi:hypothetical protein
MGYYYTLLTVFAIIVTMMVIDQNVGTYIYLIGKIVKNKIERLYWMIKFHPAIITSPIGKWWMMRKYMKTVEKLAQELSQKQQDGV